MGGRETGLALAQIYWGADAEVNLEGPPARSAAFSQTFTAPNDNRPMLHGYHVQTEGVQFVLKSERLKSFVHNIPEPIKAQGNSAWCVSLHCRCRRKGVHQLAGKPGQLVKRWVAIW